MLSGVIALGKGQLKHQFPYLKMANIKKGSKSRPKTDLTEDELLLEALGRLEEEFPTGDGGGSAKAAKSQSAPAKTEPTEPPRARPEKSKKREAEKRDSDSKKLPEKTKTPAIPAAPTAAAVAAGLRRIDPIKKRQEAAPSKSAPVAQSKRSSLESAPAGAGLTRIVPTREMPEEKQASPPKFSEAQATTPGVTPLPKPEDQEPSPAGFPPAKEGQDDTAKLPVPKEVPSGPPVSTPVDTGGRGGGGLIMATIVATGAALGLSWFVLIPEYLKANPPVAGVNTSASALTETDNDGEPTLVGLEKGEMRELREQLEILKARNRLTFLADRAISEAERSAYFELRQMLTDPEYDRYRVSINTEINRIDRFYMDGTRLGNRPLPVDELFPVGEAESEAELTTAQLIALLNERSASWQHRARAANLLGVVGTEKALESLALAAGTEANLDALKEIIYSFEESTGYRGRYLFDTDSLFKWWVSESARRQETEKASL